MCYLIVSYCCSENTHITVFPVFPEFLNVFLLLQLSQQLLSTWVQNLVRCSFWFSWKTRERLQRAACRDPQRGVEFVMGSCSVSLLYTLSRMFSISSIYIVISSKYIVYMFASLVKHHHSSFPAVSLLLLWLQHSIMANNDSGTELTVE